MGYRMKLRGFTSIFVFVGMFILMLGSTRFMASEISISDDYSYIILEDNTIEITAYKGNETTVELPSDIEGRKVVSIGDTAFQNSQIESLYIPDTVERIGESSFHGCTLLELLKFYGDAPVIGEQAFASVECNVYYPVERDSWTDENMSDYGGTLKWKGFYDSAVEISDLKIVDCTGKVSIEWALNGKADGFEIQYCLDNSFSDESTNTIKISGGERINGVIQLESGKKYYIKVRAYIKNGRFTFYSSWSEEKEIELPQGHMVVIDEGENATCFTDGKTQGQHCSACNQILIEQEIIPAGHIWKEEYTTDKQPTCTEKGSKSIHCSICDSVKEGSKVEIEAKGHIWKKEHTTDKQPTYTEKGSKSIHCSLCDEIKEGSKVEIEVKVVPKKGTVLKFGKDTYKVTKAGLMKGEAALVKMKSTGKTVSIPSTIKVYGITYKVTSVASNAFKDNKKATKITIGKNVVSIGKNAFRNCTSLSSIVIPNKVKIIGSGAFYGCKKMTSVTIGTSLISMEKEAFKGCSKLGKITIKSAKLESVGKNAFNNIKATATIKVPSKKLDAYKKILKGKGLSNQSKIQK